MPAPTPLPDWAEHPEPLRRGPVVGEAVRLAVGGWKVLLTGEQKRALFLPGLQEHGHLDATSDLEELERRVWAARDRIATAGVAVLVGGATEPFAVDCDGPCAVAWAEKTLGDRLAEVPHERTSKGLHLFFAAAPEFRREVRFQPEGWSCECGGGCGIDLLGHLAEDESRPPSERRTAQALVVAPSPGRSWVGPGRGLPAPEALPPLPEGWLVQRPRPRREAAPVQIVSLPEGVAGTEAGLRALERVCKRMAAARTGGRHDTLLRLGRLVGGWVGAGHLEATYAAARLAAAVPGPRNNPAEDLATARWAVQRGAEAPLDPSDPGPGGGPGGGKVRSLPRDTVVSPSSLVPTTTIGEARTSLQAQITGVPVGRGLLLEATVGVGKTTVLLPSVIHTEVSAGRSVLVSTPTKDLVDQSVAVLREKNLEAFPHYGRHSMAEDFRLEGSCAAKNVVSDGNECEDECEDEWDGPPKRAYSSELRDYARGQVDTIREVSEQRHPIFARTCQSCIMGQKTTLEHSRELNSPPQRAIRLEKDRQLRERLEKLGISYNEIPVCEYVIQRQKETGNFLDEDGTCPPAPTTIVATHSAVSPDLLRAPSKGRDKIRLLAADETWALTEQVVVGPDDVAKWMLRLATWRAGLEQGLAGLEAAAALAAGSGGGATDRGRAIAARRKMISEARAVSDALAAFNLELVQSPELFSDERVLSAWRSVAAAAAALVKTGKPRATTAPWEEIASERTDEGDWERVIPLRAIADTLEFAIPRESVGAIRVAPPSKDGAARLRFLAAVPATHILIGDWPDFRWMLLDATVPWAVRKLVEAQAEAGEDVRIVRQPARVGRVVVHTSRTFGRGRYRGLRSSDPKAEDRATQALRRDVGFVIHKTRQFVAEHPGETVSVLSHKPIVQKLQERLEKDDELGDLLAAGVLRLGWFGRDDKGTNRFAGSHLLIFGIPVPPPVVMQAMWDETRALLFERGEDLPEWDEKPEDRVRVIRRLPDGSEVPMRVWGPRDPLIREWWDYTLSSAVAQIAGRARPADNPDVEIQMWSGFVPDLGQFGFETTVEDDEPTVIEDVNTAKHLKSMHRVALAVTALAAEGEEISVRKVQAWCRRHDLPAPRSQNVMSWLRQLHEAGRLPEDPDAARELREELDVVADRLAEPAVPDEVEAAMWEAVERAAQRGSSPSVLSALGFLAGNAHAVAIGLAAWDENGVVARAGP